MRTPLLDQIMQIDDLRRLSEGDLTQVANELRTATISAVAKTGGHLGAGLGVVELTVALHYVFATPKDRLIWDVGHQAYPHKILTGRRDRITSLRQKMAYPALRNAANPSLTRSGQGIHQPLFRPALGWRLPVKCKAFSAM